MANHFVRSGGDGGTWTGTVATLAAGLAAAAAGDDIYVSEDHSETQASALTLTSPGTASNPCRVICANHAGSFPPASADITTGAQIATTGASTITLAGFVSLCVGLKLLAGDAANVAKIITPNWKLKNCALVLGGTNGNNYIQGASSTGTESDWDNVTLQFGATGQFLHNISGNLKWKNTPNAIQGAILPTVLITNVQSTTGVMRLRGIDLSALSGKSLVGPSMTTMLDAILEDCKIPASFTLLNAPTNPWPRVITTRSSNGAVNYNQTLDTFYGTQRIEATIVRSGGATDNTTPISWKFDTATAAKASWTTPFISLPINIWNDVAGANVTVTVFGVWAGGAVPNNDDIWMEIDYMGSSASPQATILNTTKANYLAAHAAVGSDASSWASSPGTAFKLTTTLSAPQPGMKGPMVVRIYIGAQAVFYIDPKVVLS